jgi:hypothetical protein
MVLVGECQKAIGGETSVAESQWDHVQLVAEGTGVTNLPPGQRFKYMDT